MKPENVKKGKTEKWEREKRSRRRTQQKSSWIVGEIQIVNEEKEKMQMQTGIMNGFQWTETNDVKRNEIVFIVCKCTRLFRKLELMACMCMCTRATFCFYFLLSSFHSDEWERELHQFTFVGFLAFVSQMKTCDSVNKWLPVYSCTFYKMKAYTRAPARSHPQFFRVFNHCARWQMRQSQTDHSTFLNHSPILHLVLTIVCSRCNIQSQITLAASHPNNWW